MVPGPAKAHDCTSCRSVSRSHHQDKWSNSSAWLVSGARRTDFRWTWICIGLSCLGCFVRVAPARIVENVHADFSPLTIDTSFIPGCGIRIGVRFRSLSLASSTETLMSFPSTFQYRFLCHPSRSVLLHLRQHPPSPQRGDLCVLLAAFCSRQCRLRAAHDAVRRHDDSAVRGRAHRQLLIRYSW